MGGGGGELRGGWRIEGGGGELRGGAGVFGLLNLENIQTFQ